MSFKKPQTLISKTSQNQIVFSKNPQENAFYLEFIKLNMFEHAELKTYQIREQQNGAKVKPFVAFIVSISTTDIQFNISKRYSQFHELFKIISNKIQLINDNFPKRTFLTSGALQENVIRHRIEYFNKFIRQIESIKQKFHTAYFQFFKFLQIQQKYKLQKILLPSQIEKNKNQGEDILIQNLVKLSEEKNYNHLPIINQLQKQIFENKIRLSSQIIRQFFFGLGKRRGVIEIALNTSQTEVCQKLLELVNKCFSFQQNREAEVYIKIFSTCGINSLIIQNPQMLELSNIKLNYFNILKVHFDKNCEGKFQDILQCLLRNKSLTKQYNLWLKSRQKNSVKVELYEEVPTPKTAKSTTTETFNYFMNVVEYDYVEWEVVHERKQDEYQVTQYRNSNNFIKIVFISTLKMHQLDEIFVTSTKWNTHVTEEKFDHYLKSLQYKLDIKGGRVFNFNFQITTDSNCILSIKKPLPTKKQQKVSQFNSYYEVVKLSVEQMEDSEEVISTIQIWNYYESESSQQFFESEVIGETTYLFDTIVDFMKNRQ